MKKWFKDILYWPIDVFLVWKRELNLAFHDEAVIIFFLVLCAVYPVLYSLIYNTETAHDVKVVVIDNDRSQLSRQMIRELDATPEVCVMDYVSNMEDARTLMNEHECYGIVFIPRDFSSNIVSGSQGHVSLYSDMGVLVRYKQMFTALTNVQQDMCSKLQAAKLGKQGSGSTMIIESKQVPLGNTSMGLASAVLPCILVLVLQQSMILGICVLRAGARERRLRHRGYDPMDVGAGTGASIIGKMLCHWVIYIIPTFYVLHFVPIFFSFPQNGNTLQIMIFMLPFLFASSLLGQTLQVFVNDRESTFLVMAFTSIIFVFLSGISFPRYMMSQFWNIVGNMIPSTAASNGYIAMASNGATLGQISDSYIWLWILCGFFFISAYMVERNICRPRYRRMQMYAELDPDALLKEERRRNAVDEVGWD